MGNVSAMCTFIFYGLLAYGLYHFVTSKLMLVAIFALLFFRFASFRFVVLVGGLIGAVYFLQLNAGLYLQ